MGLRADVTSFYELSAKLRATQSAVGDTLRKNIGLAAEGVVEEGKQLTAYAVRIPISEKVVTPTLARITTTGGGANKSDAIGAIIENSGKGYVRHPVFEVSVLKGGGGRYQGKRGKGPKPGLSRRGGIAPWTSKHSHPEFMNAALKARERQSHDLIISSLVEAFREVDL